MIFPFTNYLEKNPNLVFDTIVVDAEPTMELKCTCIHAYLDGSDTWGPMSTTSFLEVLWFLRDFPRTTAPLAYASFVAKVTNAWSVKGTDRFI